MSSESFRVESTVDGSGLEARLGDELACRITFAAAGAGVEAEVVVREWSSSAEPAAVLDALCCRGAAQGGPVVRLITNDLPLRHIARTAGWAGELRGSLARTTPSDAQVLDLDATLANVQGVTGVERPQAGRVGRMARRATAGLTVTRLRVDAGADRWEIDVPVGADLMPEAVACAMDTTLAVKRRFVGHLPVLRTFSFDRSSRGFQSDRHAGEAHGSRGGVHLNAGLVTLDGMIAMRRDRDDRPPERLPVGALAPATVVDVVMAHELWHIVELTWQARRYAETIEFRRRLGDALGVETLEHAILGRAPGASPDRRAANDRLAAEISGYAATAPLEATAELFNVWWSGQAPVGGLAERFGSLVDEYLPEP